jgi:Na+-transporting NADH:ubiquinone oxidoreductase subunit A
MGLIKIKKGLNLPIKGEPIQEISYGKNVQQVALLGSDYVGMKPLFMVVPGDKVKLGQLLYVDKKMPFVKYTSPGAGKISAIHRGAKRAFISVVIELDGAEAVTFQAYSEKQLHTLDRKKVISQLLESGQWTAIRSRPYSKVANPETTPHSIFVTAMDTQPLAPSVEKILAGREEDFQNGLTVLSRLTDGKLYLCKAPGVNIPTGGIPSLSVEEFAGPHPSGNVGTHMHFLNPVYSNKFNWYVGAQDVTAIGKLFRTGEPDMERVISVAGPGVKNPRLIKTRIGASLKEITHGELHSGVQRIISGSVLSGNIAEEANGYLGRFHQQVTVIPEFIKLGFFGWMNPGYNLFSVKNILLSRLFPWKKFNFTTALHGGERAIVPIGSYEKVMPLDILPTHLLRALVVDDIEEAEKLGCLELDEEDLALCTLVCQSKIDHGHNLRRNLTIIEKEG